MAILYCSKGLYLRKKRHYPAFSLKIYIRLSLALFLLEGSCCYPFWKKIGFFDIQNFYDDSNGTLLAALCCCEVTAWGQQWVGTIVALSHPSPPHFRWSHQRRQAHYGDKEIWVSIRGHGLSKANLENLHFIRTITFESDFLEQIVHVQPKVCSVFCSELLFFNKHSQHMHAQFLTVWRGNAEQRAKSKESS